jgi:predicted N-acetyltransferase YhbS
MDSEYDVPEDVFMVLALKPDALHGKTGRVKYHAAFNRV